MDPNLTAPGAAPDGSFRAGQPFAQPRVPSTSVTAKQLNSQRSELLNLLAAAGIDPSPNDDTQLLQAIRALYVQGLPPGQRSQLDAWGHGGDPDFESWEQVCNNAGNWTCGLTAAGGPPDAPYYEEGVGEYYNTCGPQQLTSGAGGRLLDSRVQDYGIWLPRGKYLPGDLLWGRLMGRIQNADAGTRNFHLCLDPNGDVATKLNSWGSNDATVLIAEIPTAIAPTRLAFTWDFLVYYHEGANNLITSRLDIGHKEVVSGKRYRGGDGYSRTWAVDHLGSTGWDFINPPTGAGKSDYGGATRLGVRWAVNGTQDGTAQMAVLSLKAWVSRHRYN